MTGAEKDQRIQALEQENQALQERIVELERRLGLNSGNSSNPPSSDGLKKKQKRTQSLRSKSKRSSGGQRHQGQTLKQVLEPDRIINHSVSTETITWYRIATKPKDLEPLKGIEGVVVHDHWKPDYQIPDVAHQLFHKSKVRSRAFKSFTSR